MSNKVYFKHKHIQSVDTNISTGNITQCKSTNMEESYYGFTGVVGNILNYIKNKGCHKYQSQNKGDQDWVIWDSSQTPEIILGLIQIPNIQGYVGLAS